MFNIIFCDQKKTNIFSVAVGFNLISTPVHQILPPNTYSKACFQKLIFYKLCYFAIVAGFFLPLFFIIIVENIIVGKILQL